jgi:uncharacterized membrane protein YagU involved in acid resistance
MMDSKKVKQALIGGIIAAAVMTVLMVVAAMMGMPDMKIGNMIAGFIGIPVWAGWTMHLMIGIVWAMAYVFLVRDRFTQSPALKGMLFAILPWMLMQLMVTPMMGMGIFSANSPDAFEMVIGTLMGHLVYGLVLGISTKQE